MGKELLKKLSKNDETDTFMVEFPVLGGSGTYFASSDTKDKDVQSDPYHILFSLDTTYNDPYEPNQKISIAPDILLKDIIKGVLQTKTSKLMFLLEEHL